MVIECGEIMVIEGSPYMNPEYFSLLALSWIKLDIAVKTRTKQKILRERFGKSKKRDISGTAEVRVASKLNFCLQSQTFKRYLKG